MYVIAYFSYLIAFSGSTQFGIILQTGSQEKYPSRIEVMRLCHISKNKNQLHSCSKEQTAEAGTTNKLLLLIIRHSSGILHKFRCLKLQKSVKPGFESPFSQPLFNALTDASLKGQPLMRLI